MANKRRETYIPTPRGRKVGGVLIALAGFGFLVLTAYLGTLW